MKLKKIVEQIKSALVSGAESENAVKVCALEYANASMYVCSLVERAVEVSKAGLKSDAIMFAQKNNILEKAQTLAFTEAPLWASYCKQNALIVPPVPLAESLEIIKRLFERNIEQTNFLFRDYRRAMRLKDFDLGLSCIEAIAKINPEDNRVKDELMRIKRGLTGRKIRRAIEIMNSTDVEENSEFLEICSFLEENVSNSKNYPSLELIFARRQEVCARMLASKQASAIEKLKLLDVEKNTAEILDLLDAVFVQSPAMSLFDEDYTFATGKIEEVETYLRSKIAEEKMRIAATRAALILSKPDGKSKCKRIAELKQLREDAKDALSPETSKLLNKKIHSLWFSLVCKISFTSVVVIFLILVAQNVCQYSFKAISHKNTIEDLNKALNKISMTDDPFVMQKSLAEVENNYKDYLQEASIAPIYKQVKSQVDATMMSVNRLTSELDKIEKIDVANATSRECQEILENLAGVGDSVGMLPSVASQKIKMRLEKIKASVETKIEERKLATSAKIKKLLADYEAVLSAYEGFSGNRAKLDAQLASIVPDLRLLMEDTSALFRPHRIDVDKFNDISSRIADAKKRYGDFDDERKALLASKSVDEYLAVANRMKQNPFLPADFYKKLEKVMSQSKLIKAGQLVDFADISAIDFANNVGAFTRLVDKPSPMLVNVYKYSLNSRSVYVLGEATRSENVWAQGKEIMQRAELITSNGKTSPSLYRLHQIFGKEPTGEILTGGVLTAESVFATEIQNVASKKSLISAVEAVSAVDVNPIFKLMLEQYLFDEMRKSPIHSGLLFSSKALAREKLVRKFSHGLSVHSWMFESDEAKDNIKQNLYNSKAENYQQQARENINAIILAQKYPLKMVGIEGDANSKRVLFGDIISSVWAISSETGKFCKLGNIDSASIAPLSPIFVEVKSSAEILQNVKSK